MQLDGRQRDNAKRDECICDICLRPRPSCATPRSISPDSFSVQNLSVNVQHRDVSGLAPISNGVLVLPVDVMPLDQIVRTRTFYTYWGGHGAKNVHHAAYVRTALSLSVCTFASMEPPVRQPMLGLKPAATTPTSRSNLVAAPPSQPATMRAPDTRTTQANASAAAEDDDV